MIIPPNTNPVEDFLLGGIAAVLSRTVVYPYERIKLILTFRNIGNPDPITKPYTGIIDVIKRVPKEEGFLYFWKGNTTNIIKYFPKFSLNFMFKDIYNQCLQSSGLYPCLCTNMIAGGVAGATSLLVLYPLDLARARLASDITTREFKGIGDWIFKDT